VRNGRDVRLRVELGVLVTWLNERVLALLGLGHEIALALLERGRRGGLILAVLGHDLLELLILVMHVINLLALRRNQEPLVHVDHINVHKTVLLLKALGVARGLVPSREAPANLQAELLVLLGKVRAHKRNACKKLSWHGQVILLQRTHLKHTRAYFLSQMDELRRLHNDCKRQLILKWVPRGAHVLDCGCGRGGDWWKWKAVRARVSAIDPDLESLKEAEDRALDMKFGVWFLGQGDIRQAAFAGPFDVICYNFSLQYIVDAWEDSLKAMACSLETGGLLIGIAPEKARAEAMVNERGHFEDRLGNSFDMYHGGRRMMVHLSDGPFYQDGPKDEPVLDATILIEKLKDLGFEKVIWEPMLASPNGLISDLYSKFVFRKIR
jgi:ubiquinone/menaquinone biosynthesis C-methylase UbiE